MPKMGCWRYNPEAPALGGSADASGKGANIMTGQLGGLRGCRSGGGGVLSRRSLNEPVTRKAAAKAWHPGEFFQSFITGPKFSVVHLAFFQFQLKVRSESQEDTR